MLGEVGEAKIGFIAENVSRDGGGECILGWGVGGNPEIGRTAGNGDYFRRRVAGNGGKGRMFMEVEVVEKRTGVL